MFFRDFFFIIANFLLFLNYFRAVKFSPALFRIFLVVFFFLQKFKNSRRHNFLANVEILKGQKWVFFLQNSNGNEHLLSVNFANMPRVSTTGMNRISIMSQELKSIMGYFKQNMLLYQKKLTYPPEPTKTEKMK